MTHILMSINPKPLSEILNGSKTIEIRKTIPACLKNGEPVEAWMYCAKNNGSLFSFIEEKRFIYHRGNCHLAPFSCYKKLNGLVVCKFVVEPDDVVETYKSLLYAQKNKVEHYELYISALKIIAPMKLEEFKHEVNVWVSEYQAFTDELRPITKAPQSWMYIFPPKEGEGK